MTLHGRNAGSNTSALVERVRWALTAHGWRPGELPEPPPDAALEPVVGVDVGGTKIHAALVPPAGPPLIDATVATDPRGNREVVGQIAALVEKLTDQTEHAEQPRRIGIGTPGAPDPVTGTVAHAPNIPGWDQLDVAAELESRLGARPVLHNDVNLAAWGERFWNAEHSGGDLAFVAVGTGIGLGLILADQLHRGGHGLAGEIGDLPFGADPFEAENLVHGPLETEVSGRGIERAYVRAGGSARLSVPEIFEAATAGDVIAERVIDDIGRLLAMTLRSVRAIVDPDTYVLGGGIGSRPETLAATLRWLEPVPGPDWRVHLSTLGPRATVAGALAIACSDMG
ncbi:ROK family protein [Phytoactinopolyspora mesophila]|uniref:ROK family protein n=1 Tax=Phytoactinopolyspora mesophila TaxID=2650750 RepID=UPI00139102E3